MSTISAITKVSAAAILIANTGSSAQAMEERQAPESQPAVAQRPRIPRNPLKVFRVRADEELTKVLRYRTTLFLVNQFRVITRVHQVRAVLVHMYNEMLKQDVLPPYKIGDLGNLTQMLQILHDNWLLYKRFHPPRIDRAPRDRSSRRPGVDVLPADLPPRTAPETQEEVENALPQLPNVDIQPADLPPRTVTPEEVEDDLYEMYGERPTVETLRACIRIIEVNEEIPEKLSRTDARRRESILAHLLRNWHVLKHMLEEIVAPQRVRQADTAP
ncbi:MAG: hypothetical protein LBJ42_01370 [Holosporales bacterium]|jgi:hypothetical protein|nr:hypothetical protein [Holosporales bacterium]